MNDAPTNDFRLPLEIYYSALFIMRVYIYTAFIISVLAHPSALTRAATTPEHVETLPSDHIMNSLTNQAESRENEEINHQTSLGTATGLREPMHGKDSGNSHLFAFRGIPYAKPPIGHLRWTEPMPVTSWENGHLDARTFGAFCPQYDYSSARVLGHENCLFLNVFTPKLPGKSGLDSKLPVFVFLHGGGYLRGSSSAHGPHKLLTKDIVLVTVNYRLSAFGFLSTENFEFPGNYGLLDQEAALVWVQNHISEFGGDPQRVTLGGFSAGGSSTHIHSLSPRSKGLFHSAIMMSGSAHAPWALQRQPRHYAKKFAEILNCPFLNSTKLRSCLEMKSTYEIIYAQASMHKYEFIPAAFGPVVDASFRKEPILLNLPAYLVPHTKMPVIIGTVPDEGLLFSANFILGAENPRNASDVYREQAHITFDFITNDMDFENQPYMSKLGENMYFSSEGKQNMEVFFNDMVEAMTDYFFTLPAYEAARQFSEANSTVYSYLMSYRDKDTPTWALPIYNLLRKNEFSPALLDTGVSHGDDLIHIFSFPYAMGKFTQQDQDVSEILISMWTNFITTGSPQDASITDHTLWMPVDKNSEDVSYYNISPHPIMIQGSYKRKQQSLWYQIVIY
ncbi:unnamed protein product, partial [Meganyctiphanes norvegica]